MTDSHQHIHLQCFGIHIGPRSIIQPFEAKAQIGKCIAVIGKNGIGKTTLLSSMAKIWKSSSTVWKRSGNIIDVEQVSWLPQHGEYHPHFRVDEVVMLGRFLEHKGFPQTQDRRICVEVLQHFDLTNLKNRRMDELSGGEQQRVLMARAMVSQRPLIVLDEPFSGLDMSHGLSLQKLLKSTFCSESVVIYSVHDFALLSHHRGEVWAIDEDGHISKYPHASSLQTDDFRRIFDVKVEIQFDEANSLPFFHVFS